MDNRDQAGLPLFVTPGGLKQGSSHRQILISIDIEEAQALRINTANLFLVNLPDSQLGQDAADLQIILLEMVDDHRDAAL